MSADTVTKETLVGEIVYNHPETMNVFFSIGMHCLGCPASQMESLEDAALVHGFNPDVVLNAVNNAIIAQEEQNQESATA